LHSAGQLCGAVPTELWQFDEFEHFARTPFAVGPFPPHQLEWKLDVLGDCAPIEKARLLEGHAIVLIEPGLLCGLRVDLD